MPGEPTSEQPTFSVVIPTYNYAHTLRRTLDSIAAQSALSGAVAADVVEVVVIDDGSTDDTEAVARLAFTELFEPAGVQCVYERQDNAGLAAARNTGLDRVEGQWTWFLDADDELTPDAFAIIRRAIAAGGDDLLLAFGGYRSVTALGDGRLKTRDKPASPAVGDVDTDFRRYLDRKLDGLVPGTGVVRSDVAKDVRFAVECVRSQDIVFFGHVLARGPAASATGADGIVMIGHRHAGSLRKDATRMRQAEPWVVKSLFDPAKLPARFMPLRDRFAGRYGLDVATNYYRSGAWADSRRAFREAVAADWRGWLSWRHVGRYLRAKVRALLRR